MTGLQECLKSLFFCAILSGRSPKATLAFLRDRIHVSPQHRWGGSPNHLPAQALLA